MPNLYISPVRFYVGNFDSLYRYVYKDTVSPTTYIPMGPFIDLQSTGEFRVVSQSGSSSTAGYTGSFTGNGFMGVSN